jgi:hypothetical protein
MNETKRSPRSGRDLLRSAGWSADILVRIRLRGGVRADKNVRASLCGVDDL